MIKGFILLMALFMIGCNNGINNQSTDTQTDKTLLGWFIDEPVNGLYYKTQTQSGFTNGYGLFRFKEGETIEFYLGNDENGLKLGSINAKKMVTPNDISQYNKDDAVSIVQLLLSISTLSDGVMEINTTTRELFQNSAFKNKDFLSIVATEGFDSKSALGNFIITKRIAKEVVSKDSATVHYDNLINNITPKIGILVDFKNPIFKDINTTLIPLVKSEISNYLIKNKISFHNIDIILKDTKNDPQTALKGLEELHNSGIEIVIGPVSSTIAKDIVGYANENGMLLLSPSSTSASLEIADDNLFRMISSDKEQAKALTLLIKHNTNIKYLLPIIRDDEYGNSYFQTLQNELEGTQITLLDKLSSNDTNLFSKAEKTLAQYDANSVAIVMIDFHEEAKDILQKASTTSLQSVKWYSNNSLIDIDLNSSLADMANSVALSGVTYTTDDRDFYVYYQSIVSKLKAKGLESVDPFLMNVWDSIWLSAELYATYPNLLILKSSNNIVQIKQTIPFLSATLYGATGLMTLNEYGDRELANYSYYQFQNGKWNNIGIYKHRPLEADKIVIDDVTSHPDINKSITIGAIIDNAYWNETSKELIELAKNRMNDYFQNKNVHFEIALKVKENNGTNISNDIMLDELKDFHDKGIQTVITMVPSRALEVMQEEANNYGMILIDCASTAPSIAKNDTTFRLTPNDTGEVKALNYLLEKESVKNVVLVSVNDVFGNDYVNAFKDEYKGNILKEITFEEGKYLDPQELSNQLQGLNDFAIVYIALEKEGVDFTKLNTTLQNVKWYGSGASAFNTTILNSGADFKFAVYDVAGLGFFLPQVYSLQTDINTSTTTSSVNAYDAVFLGAVSNFDSLYFEKDLKTSVTDRSRSMYGMSFFLGTDINGDRATLSYVFYSNIYNNWKKIGIYNNAGYGIKE